MSEKLEGEEKVMFQMNPKVIDWKILGALNVYGM